MPTRYTRPQVDMVLDGFFRDARRPRPLAIVAQDIGLDSHEGLDDLLWKVITGYGGRDPDGPRRVYRPTLGRVWRGGWVWHGREDDALRAALAGEGQRRQPPCDVAYVATVLQRTEAEVAARWAELQADPLGRVGFFNA